MNLRTKVLAALWAALVGLTAWHATAPNPYLEGILDPAVAEQYPWEYPLLTAVVGGVLILLLRPWRATHSFFGAMIGFALCFVFSISAFVSLMHAPPVHTTVALSFFFLSLALLFYTGFAFAGWRAG